MKVDKHHPITVRWRTAFQAGGEQCQLNCWRRGISVRWRTSLMTLKIRHMETSDVAMMLIDISDDDI